MIRAVEHIVGGRPRYDTPDLESAKDLGSVIIKSSQVW